MLLTSMLAFSLPTIHLTSPPMFPITKIIFSSALSSEGRCYEKAFTLMWQPIFLFSSSFSITIFPHLILSLKAVFLEQINYQEVNRTWNQVSSEGIRTSFRSYWENEHEGLKSWWVWDENPPGKVLVRNSVYSNWRMIF